MRKVFFRYWEFVFALFLILSVTTACTNQNNTTQTSNNSKITVDDKKIASEIDNEIISLGDTNTLTLDKESIVVSIRNKFDSLTPEQAKYVTKLDTLVAAEKKLVI